MHESSITEITINRSVVIDGDITNLAMYLYGDSDIERTIYVPSDSYDAYTQDQFWYRYTEDITTIE